MKNAEARELWEARHQAMVKNYNMRSLETVVGKHAVYLVDYANETDENKQKQLTVELGSLVEIWADILSSNNEFTKHLRTGNEEQIDNDFKMLVRNMIMEFTYAALELVRPNSRPLNIEAFEFIKVYMVVSKKAGRHYEQTKRHLQEYAFFLYKVGNATPGTENASLAGASCIWSGIHLGTYLDQML